MTERPLPKSIKYIQERVEVEIPDQLKNAESILGRLTMQYHGQLQLVFPEELQPTDS